MKKEIVISAGAVYFVPLLVFLILVAAASPHVSGQTQTTTAIPGTADKTPTKFRIGERLTYESSFDRFDNVAYFETFVVSRGTLSGRDSVELRSKVKTSNIVSAAFYYLDETRTTYVDPQSGMPLYSTISENLTGIAEVTNIDNLTIPATEFDLLSVLYKIRQSSGTGSFPIKEGGKVYSLSFQMVGTEPIETLAGTFETTEILLQSEYFSGKGIAELRINLSADEAKIPVLIRFKKGKAEFRGSLASVQIIEPIEDPGLIPVDPQPQARPTPRQVPTPTPVVYVNDQELSKELAFKLGERMEYTITSGGRQVGLLTLHARERRMVNGRDSLLLTATITGIDQANSVFRLNDSMTTQVHPETLAPFSHVINFGGALSGSNQTAVFDDKRNSVTVNAGTSVNIPNGTHNVLSLLYSMRSFNLVPSPISTNPVNDTRVAMFWGQQPYVFSLRPAAAQQIDLAGEKVSAQLITITAGSPAIDTHNIRVWLAADPTRRPLRFTIGQHQFELAAVSNSLSAP